MVNEIDVTVSEDDLFGGAMRVVSQIRPQWNQKRINFKMLTDGITNKLVKCALDGAPERDSVLVRVYGNKTDLLIDRKAETRNIILLNNAGLAPNLYATFNNGLAYEFVPGCTLTVETVTNPEIYKLIAQKMAKLHAVTVPGDSSRVPCLWNKIDAFLQLVPDKFDDQNKQKKYEQIMPSKVELAKEIQYLKDQLSIVDSPIVFSHNDLLLGNVIYTASDESVTFIDYEYAAFNYQAFDIGNHFNEFVGIDVIDYSKYPSKEFQYKWLKEYISDGISDVTDEDVEELYIQVNKFGLASHILWSIWALIQAEHSYIDFDFMGYAAIRYNEYLTKRDEFLSLEKSR